MNADKFKGLGISCKATLSIYLRTPQGGIEKNVSAFICGQLSFLHFREGFYYLSLTPGVRAARYWEHETSPACTLPIVVSRTGVPGGSDRAHGRAQLAARRLPLQ